MNMWFKLVENQRANYEILAKFLIQNLSSLQVKLKDDSPIEFERHKRYSINIFNYIKARV